MNCNFKDLVEMKKEYDSKDVQDVILDLSKLYRLYTIARLVFWYYIDWRRPSVPCKYLGYNASH